MSTPASVSRSIALTYAILAAMYLAIIAVLGNSLWVDSLRRLWQDAREFSNTLVLLLALFAIHAAMSVLSLRFTRLGSGWRLITLGASACLLAVACFRAAALLIAWFRGRWEQAMPLYIIPASIVLVVGYAVCTWYLSRIHATANQRLERP
jgi:hypothetical protein